MNVSSNKYIYILDAVIALNANLHAGPFICILIDHIFNSVSFPKKHYPIIFIFGVAYLTINLSNN